MIEKRQYARTPIDLPVVFAVKDANQWANGIGKNVSVGGISIETETPAPFGAAVVVRIRLRTPSDGERDFDLPGTVRWTRVNSMGVQFGLIGAVETHAITELTRDSGR